MIGGLILAAGAGRRFGGPKQLATIDGESLVERAVRQMTAAGGLDEIVLVLGAAAEQITQGDRSLRGARIVVCADWAEGQAASLRCGIAALGAVEAVVVTLADQPLVGTAAIERVLGARRAGSAAVRATYGGVAGHPVLLESRILPDVLELRGDVGARAVLKGEDVAEIACDDVGAPQDVDTPADLAAVRAAQGVPGGS